MAAHQTGAMSVILPALPPESQTLTMPDSLNPEDRAFLIKELGKISSAAAVQEERVRVLHARLDKLESKADASGEHKAIQLQAQIDKRDQDAALWRARVWSIVAVLLTSAIVGLITHWLATR